MAWPQLWATVALKRFIGSGCARDNFWSAWLKVQNGTVLLNLAETEFPHVLCGVLCPKQFSEKLIFFEIFPVSILFLHPVYICVCVCVCVCVIFNTMYIYFFLFIYFIFYVLYICVIYKYINKDINKYINKDISCIYIFIYIFKYLYIFQ